MEKIIEISKLTKKYADFIAVAGISFAIKKGEIFGLLGPNGAGKTTTINMLIGMAKVSSGNIFYNGVNLTKNLKKAQELIGVVADESNLYSEMSGYDNLCFCGSLYGMSKNERERKAEKMLEIFQLKKVANKKFQAYSKGMKRKLTIAAAFRRGRVSRTRTLPVTDYLNQRRGYGHFQRKRGGLSGLRPR